MDLLQIFSTPFLKVSLKSKDRNAVKFMWRDRDSEELKILRIVLATPSLFILGATMKLAVEKYNSYYPKTFYLLHNCLYVNDLILRADTIEEPNKIRKILCEGCFNMRKWATNQSSLKKA